MPLNHPFTPNSSLVTGRTRNGKFSPSPRRRRRGHCRHENELRDAENLRCVTESWRWPLRELLPHALGRGFTPAGGRGTVVVGDQGGGHAGETNARPSRTAMDSWVRWRARRRARWWMYSDGMRRGARSREAVTERWRSRTLTVAFGRASPCERRAGKNSGVEFECAAYNPSMSPLQVVIARWWRKGKIYPPSSTPCCPTSRRRVKYDCTVRLALAKIAPKADSSC